MVLSRDPASFPPDRFVSKRPALSNAHSSRAAKDSRPCSSTSAGRISAHHTQNRPRHIVRPVRRAALAPRLIGLEIHALEGLEIDIRRTLIVSRSTTPPSPAPPPASAHVERARSCAVTNQTGKRLLPHPLPPELRPSSTTSPRCASVPVAGPPCAYRHGRSPLITEATFPPKSEIVPVGTIDVKQRVCGCPCRRWPPSPLRKPGDTPRGEELPPRSKSGNAPFSSARIAGGQVSRLRHPLHPAPRERRRFFGAVALPDHHQRIGEPPGDPEPDPAAWRAPPCRLLRQRETRGAPPPRLSIIPHGQAHEIVERRLVELPPLFANGCATSRAKVHRSKKAGAIGRQGLLAAGVFVAASRFGIYQRLFFSLIRSMKITPGSA